MTKDEIKKRTANLIIKHKEQLADWLYANGYTIAADYETSILRARIAELEAALKPFAEWETFTAADIRAARAALEKSNG